jgi:voltage-gated potassium channel
MIGHLFNNKNLRSRAYALVEEGDSLPSRLFNGFIMALILVNLIAIVLESDESIYQGYKLLFNDFETFSVLVFTLEYLIRVWVCCEQPAYIHPWRGRLRYMTSFMAVVDLLAILPFYLSMFIGIDTRFLRILRLLRVFKLTRHFQSLEILMQVIRAEAAVLASAVFVMFILAVLAAGGIYVVEHDVQPEVFGSIASSMWWAIVTLTTVGYGDVIPLSSGGKIFASVITMLGVGMAALPAGIIASGFTREMQKRRDIYQINLREALEDGMISKEEQQHLEQVRQHLGLNIDDTQAMTKAEFGLLAEIAATHCPHCGEQLMNHESIASHKDSDHN